MKIVSVVGARPQFVKAAVVSRGLRVKGLTEILIHTGQHYDENMSAVFFEELRIPDPNYNLEIGSGPHGQQTGRMLEGIERVLIDTKPDWVLVYGDTNSTLAGAVAGAKLHIKVAHVEAGLRSFNRSMPEEINRVLTDHVSDLLFAPTDSAVSNLRQEGITGNTVQLVGDVMYDAALQYGAEAERKSSILKKLSLQPRQYILVTVHRAENTDNLSRLSIIVNALEQLAESSRVIFPVHPRTRAMLRRRSTPQGKNSQISFVEPVGYLDMLMLEKNARLIATDSGGVQKEAFFYRIPCVTLREGTEWVELVDLGWNRVSPPTDPHRLVTALRDAMDSRPGCEANPFGDGHTSERIASLLLNRH
jgi:UDP-GlcNAc3NAcA epimerase